MKKLSLLIVLFVLGVSSLLAQTKVITGTLLGSCRGGPIPELLFWSKAPQSVLLRMQRKVHDYWRLRVQHLIFSYIGMKRQEVEIGGRSVIDVLWC